MMLPHLILAPLAAFGLLHGPAHEPMPQHMQRLDKPGIEKRADHLERHLKHMTFDELKAKALAMSTKALDKIEKRITHVTDNDNLPEGKRADILEHLNKAKSHIEEVQSKIESATTLDDLKALKP